MPKKITNFELRDAENGRVIREGDNAMLKKNGVYSVANDEGEWKPFYVVDLDASEEPTPDPEPEPTPNPDPDPEPTPTPGPDPEPTPDPTPVPQPVPTGSLVSTDAELAAALSTPGTYQLAPGRYAPQTVQANGVSLTSADPNNKAVLGGLVARNRSDLTLRGLHFDGPNNVFGIHALDMTNFIVASCVFTGLQKGIVTRGSNITITGNDISGFRSDGMTIDDVTNITVIGNYIHDRKSANATDHGDYIQFMGTIKGADIDDNFVDQNNGDTAQLIYLGSGADRKEDVRIRNNVVIGSQTRGVSSESMASGEVLNNRVSQIPPTNGTTGGVTIPKVNIKGNAGAINMAGNIAPQVLLAGVRRPGGNTEANLDPAQERAAAMADPRFAHFFGG